MAKVLYMFGKLHYQVRDFADALLLLGHVEFERGRVELSDSFASE
jgi:hypothetical protein